MESRNKLISLLTKKYSSQSSIIDFQEDQSSGYASRTIKNASADVTLAFALDFSTGGEVLTRESVEKQGKKYIQVPVSNEDAIFNWDFIDGVVEQFNDCDAKTLNIAGNGLYTLKGYYLQPQADHLTLTFLNLVLTSPILKNKIELIRSGGQSGFDEAGIKAAVKLDIPALILAPKGWLFRDINGNDIRDEKAFKNRFNTI